jgi:hypothetical protein
VFAHIAIHHPKPEHSEDMLASMKRVDAAAQGAEGLVQIGAWRDERTGRLIGLALWQSKEAFEAAAPGIFAAVADDPFRHLVRAPARQPPADPRLARRSPTRSPVRMDTGRWVDTRLAVALPSPRAARLIVVRG